MLRSPEAFVMSTEVTKYVLWLAAPVLQIGILLSMDRKKLRADFPFFFNYLVFQILSVALLFTVYHVSSDSYFYAYWVSSILGIGLGFAVIYEIFAYTLRPYAGLRDLGTLLFRWAAMLLVLISGITAAASTSGTEMHRLTFAIMSIERSVRLMQCGLLVFVLLCSSYLGLSLRNFACGIAFGFGIFAATDLTILNFRTQLGSNHWHGLLSLISSGVYNLSVVAWLAYSLLPQTKRLATGFVYRPLFDRWNQAAMLVVGTAAPAMSGNTYLSEIEQTVNNVLAENASRQQLVH
jgi:hypothetical protein